MLNLNKKLLDKNLNFDDGFFISRLSSRDLKYIRDIVQNHWRKVLISNYPEMARQVQNLKITSYHKLSNQINHKKLWPMKNRILSSIDLKNFLKTKIYKNIKSIYVDAEITDENDIGYGEIYWRIVRPKSPNDIGYVHTDRWFWEINNDYTPPDMRRVKFWISLWCDRKNGLAVIPKTQTKEYEFEYEFRDGENKPVFYPEKFNLKLLKLDCKPGTVVIFHDNLLHGGCINQSNYSRISIEFTIFTKK